jgi:hypothetical protein
MKARLSAFLLNAGQAAHGSITFLRGIELRELDILIEALTTEMNGTWSEWVAGKDLYHILVSPPLRLGRTNGDGGTTRIRGFDQIAPGYSRNHSFAHSSDNLPGGVPAYRFIDLDG